MRPISSIYNAALKTDNRYSRRKIAAWIVGAVAARSLWQMSKLRVELFEVTYPSNLGELRPGDHLKFKLVYEIDNPSLIGTPALISLILRPRSHDAALFTKSTISSCLSWLPYGRFRADVDHEMVMPAFAGTYSLIEAFNCHHGALRTIWLFGFLSI